MTGPPDYSTDLTTFLVAAKELWADYLRVGPGRVPSTGFEALDQVGSRLLDSDASPETTARIRELTDLCQRCACRPEGLSFIAGEYGLIPRKDQHAKFESLLDELTREQQRHAPEA